MEKFQEALNEEYAFAHLPVLVMHGECGNAAATLGPGAPPWPGSARTLLGDAWNQSESSATTSWRMHRLFVFVSVSATLPDRNWARYLAPWLVFTLDFIVAFKA